MKRILNLSVFLLAMLFAGSVACAEQPATTPNVIYILADDLGYGDLSCWGNKKLKTPNIDRLALEGLKLTNHYSANTVCTPSRHSLMSGQHAGHCLARGNGTEAKLALIEDMTVLPEVFKAAGYATGMYGKWGLGQTHEPGRSSPLTHGFDEFSAWKSQMIAHTYYPRSIVRGSNGVAKEEPLEKGTYIHDLIMNDAFSFIEKNAEAETPFFCYIPTAVPHAAMHAPKQLHEKYRKIYPQWDQRLGKYGAGPDETCPDVENPVAGFAGMMENLDNQIGQLFELLEKTGQAENTIIFFSSDNGAHREGGHHPEFWDSNGPLRGIKRDLYEGGIRAPSMVWWPEKVKAGRTSDLPSAQYDILATVCDLLDQPVPNQSTGISILPTITGEGDQKTHEYLYFEHVSGSRVMEQAIRKGDWKLVVLHPKTRKKKLIREKSVELYNLKDDLGETEDLASNKPEVVNELLALIEEVRVPLQKN